ncbi:hypothetical protein EIP91_002211 [Steccherinum ochraceum]|uniref:Uncharacterized protein n=1 Tax=Steccherinum ochraceum TaxID=92696 RepID=A0A4R0REP0_9APHY|nr:hypothetical protein EIP91_002211 [Steccherinum ochraceum]
MSKAVIRAVDRMQYTHNRSQNRDFYTLGSRTLEIEFRPGLLSTKNPKKIAASLFKREESIILALVSARIPSTVKKVTVIEPLHKSSKGGDWRQHVTVKDAKGTSHHCYHPRKAYRSLADFLF